MQMYRVVYNYNNAQIPATDHLGYFPVTTANGADSEDAAVQVNSYGPRTASFIGSNTPGSGAAPLATRAGNYLVYFIGKGYVGSPAILAAGGGTFWVQASEDFTPTARGTRIGASTTAKGTTSPVDRWYMDERESEFTVPVNAPGYIVGDVPGITRDVVIGGTTLHFTGGILTAVS